MSETSNSDTSSQLMSVDSTSLLIESLEAQVDDLMLENNTLKAIIKVQQSRIKTLQLMSDSELVNKICQFL